MRTSRVARETARLFKAEAASPTSSPAAQTPLRRSTRGSALVQRFSYKEEDHDDGENEAETKIQLRLGDDIEDAVYATATTSATRKRKRDVSAAASATLPGSTPLAPAPKRTSSTRARVETIASSSSTAIAATATRASMRTTRIKPDPSVKPAPGSDLSDSDSLSSLSDADFKHEEQDKKAAAVKKTPKKGRIVRTAARTTTTASGQTVVTPPSNWEEIYNLVKEMRISGPAANAAVDTMGCERLAAPNATPLEKRFHTLVALMLSSQTKDTVNAEAMRRLQTELPPYEPGKPAGLNLDNMLAVDPELLDELIGKIGFHRKKTEYLKKTAVILKERWGRDIPPTVEGLTSLPGVGPKMAHLCMSAEAGWNKVTGIGVDVHVHRITNLWGWQNPASKNPEETRAALESWLPRDKWKEINWLLVGFGQAVCLPIGRRCGDCTVGLKGLCKSADRAKVNAGKIKREMEVKMEVEVGVDEDEDDKVRMKREVVATTTTTRTTAAGRIKEEVDGNGDVVMESAPAAALPATIKKEEDEDAVMESLENHAAKQEGNDAVRDAPAVAAVKSESPQDDQKDAKVKEEEIDDNSSSISRASLDPFGSDVKAESEEEDKAGGARSEISSSPVSSFDSDVKAETKEEDMDEDANSESSSSSVNSSGPEVRARDAMEGLVTLQAAVETVGGRIHWPGQSHGDPDTDGSEPDNIKTEPGVNRVKQEPGVLVSRRPRPQVVKREPQEPNVQRVKREHPEPDTTSRPTKRAKTELDTNSAPFLPLSEIKREDLEPHDVAGPNPDPPSHMLMPNLKREGDLEGNEDVDSLNDFSSSNFDPDVVSPASSRRSRIKREEGASSRFFVKQEPDTDPARAVKAEGRAVVVTTEPRVATTAAVPTITSPHSKRERRVRIKREQE